MPDIIFKDVIIAGLVSLELLFGVLFSTDQILLWVNKQRNIHGEKVTAEFTN